MLLFSWLACSVPPPATPERTIATPTPTPQPKPANTAAASASIQHFASDLYQHVANANPDQDAFFSPASIAIALGMTTAGANGSTLQSMNQTLGLNTDSHAGLGELGRSWTQGSKPPLTLAVANRIWVKKGLGLSPSFEQTLDRDYDAPLGRLDFANSEDARSIINQWVERETSSRVKNLLPQRSIDTETRLVLTNAISFQADWKTPFDPKDGIDGRFVALDRTSGAVRLMSSTITVPYTETPDYQMALLPYEGDTLDLVVLLPRHGRMRQVETTLTPTMWETVLDSVSHREVVVRFPKMQVGWGRELSPHLKALGMDEAFGDSADFSNMTTEEDLSISGVFHRANVTFDEQGTEAAAATAVVMGAGGAPPPPATFNCDRPFVYAIRDRATSTFLFVGRQVTVPGKTTQ